MRASTLVVALALAAGVACEDEEGALEPPQTCGNGRLEALEACEGDQLGGYDCAHFGFSSGRLRCAETCAGFYVDGCRGVPDWAPPADPCAACGPGEVCRGHACVATCDTPATGPAQTYDVRRRAVRVEVDLPTGLDFHGARPLEVVAWHAETGATVRGALSRAGRVELRVPPGRARLYVVSPFSSVSVWAGPWLPEAGDVALELAPAWRQVRLTIADRLSSELVLRPLDAATAWPREVREASDLRDRLVPARGGRGQAWLWVVAGRYQVAYAGERHVGFGLGGVPPIRAQLEVPAGDEPLDLLLDARVQRFSLQASLPPEVFDDPPVELTRVWLGDPSEAEIPFPVDERGVGDARLPAGDYAFRFRGRQSRPVQVGLLQSFAWAPDLVGLGILVRDRRTPRLRLEQVDGPWQQEWSSARGGFAGYAPRGRVRAAVARVEAGRTAWESLGTWDLSVDPGAPGGPPLEVPSAAWASLTVDLRVGTASVSEAGAQVQLRPFDRPDLVTATARLEPGAPLVLRAPVGRYRVVLLGRGAAEVPAGLYVLDPDLALDRDATRLFDARVAPVRLRSGLSASSNAARAPRWFVAPYPGPGPDGRPQPALTGVRTVAEAPGEGATFTAFPGRYRALSLAPGTSPRAQLLDADLVFEVDGPVEAALDRRTRAVEVTVRGEADVVVFTGPTWTARVPLVDGRGRAEIPAYDYAVTVEAPDVQPRAWPVRRACGE